MTRDLTLPVSPKYPRIRVHVLAGGILAALVIGLLADVLFSSGATVISDQGGDLLSQYVYLRTFGFDRLRQGHLALWNPYLFCGIPCLEHFESALLYPLNVVYLFLPLARAINIGIALHIFLLGYFTYLWTNYRGLHPAACIVSGTLAMFCGAHYGHVYAGHLSNLCTMTWVPLLLLAIDGFFDRRNLGWATLAMGAIAMMVLAGHPQYVYYTGITAAVYCALRLIRAEHRVSLAGGLIAICIGGMALSAAQLLPGMAAAGETVRAGGTPYEFASSFSLPPENLLTLVAPFMFGPHGEFPYWGRFYSWEMSLFVGTACLALALIASIHGDRTKRRFSISMVIVLLILAIGRHTPIYDLLYTCLPGFNKFRGSAKFAFQGSLFLFMLAGMGLDHLFHGGRVGKGTWITILVASVLLAGSASWIWLAAHQDQGQSWAELLNSIVSTKEASLKPEFYSDPKAIQPSAMIASISLFIAAGTLALVGILSARLKSSQALAWSLAILSVIELVTFARIFRPTCNLAAALTPGVEQFLAKHGGDYRTLNLASPNSAMILNREDIWGYEPGVPKRYAEFMTFTQKGNPDSASQYVDFTAPHPLYRMLRLQHVLLPQPGGFKHLEQANSLPRIQLLTDFRVTSQRDQVFAMMSEPTFDPAKQVVLEREPNPAPVASTTPGTAKILDSSTDHLTIEADVTQPSILLVTDGYNSGWRARPLVGSSQQQYEVMPANYVLRAVPLAAGHHVFRMEYSPLSYRIGKWVSYVSLLAFIATIGWWIRQSRNASRTMASPAKLASQVKPCSPVN